MNAERFKFLPMFLSVLSMLFNICHTAIDPNCGAAELD